MYKPILFHIKNPLGRSQSQWKYFAAFQLMKQVVFYRNRHHRPPLPLLLIIQLPLSSSSSSPSIVATSSSSISSTAIIIIITLQNLKNQHHPPSPQIIIIIVSSCSSSPYGQVSLIISKVYLYIHLNQINPKVFPNYNYLKILRFYPFSHHHIHIKFKFRCPRLIILSKWIFIINPYMLTRSVKFFKVGDLV